MAIQKKSLNAKPTTETTSTKKKVAAPSATKLETTLRMKPTSKFVALKKLATTRKISL